jgi:hypothetical protein
MQSNKLDGDIKERVEKAIAKLGFRVTVGQVAAAAGVKLSQAEQALKALAYDSLGNLEVSSVELQEGQGWRFWAIARCTAHICASNVWYCCSGVGGDRQLWVRSVTGVVHASCVRNPSVPAACDGGHAGVAES